MARRLLLALAFGMLAAIPIAQFALAAFPGPGEPVDNQEQRVSEHGFRFGADQFLADVSGNAIVWQDQRGDVTTFNDPATGKPRNRIWFKNLQSRDESPVTTLGTDFGHPRVDGARVVWHDFVNGQHDIFTRLLPSGPIQQLTTNSKDQVNPVVFGNTVVWEDYRNGNADLFGRTVGGPEFPVVVASGRQVAPSLGSNIVAWRDSRRGTTRADVWVRAGNNAPFRAVKVTTPGVARSFGEYEVAIAGNGRLLWNEAYPGCTFDCKHPKIVKASLLPSSSTSVVDFLPNDPEDSSALTNLDVSTPSRGSWVDQNNGHLYTVDLSTCAATCAAKTEVDNGSGVIVSGRHSGTRFAWAQERNEPGLGRSLDVLWDDLPPSPPRRANSIGLGQFGQHLSPAADGDVVLYRAPGDAPNQGPASSVVQVWATDLSGTREHFAVSTELGTDSSRPGIVGARAAWSDLRNCPITDPPGPDPPGCYTHPADDSFERDPLDSGAEERLSDPEQTGGPVDVEGPVTVWRCGDNPGDPPNAICAHDGNSLQRIDVSANLIDPASTMGNEVRISGARVLWSETFFPEDGDPQTALHVLHGNTLDDEVVGRDWEGPGFGTPGFDISGTTVIFSGDDGKLYGNTATGCGGGGASCDHSGSATVFETQVEGFLGAPTIDGNRVAWVDCEEFSESGPPECDVYTRTLAESEPHLVTNNTDSNVESPFVDDALDRIYWVDHRNGNPDIFMESLDSAIGLPQPDTTAPATPTTFTATPGSGPRRIDLSWTNPPDSDFFRVRILRTSGSTPPQLGDASSSTPPFASVVYEGDGTSFTDTDVAPFSFTYSYSIFAFDLEPNFSTRATATATTP